MVAENLSNENNLDEITSSILSELKVDSNGVGYCSIRGAARLSGIDHAALIGHIQSGEKNPSKLAQMLLDKGFELVTFSTEGIPDIALGLILKYYAYKAGARCTQQAELAHDAFEAIGIRAWIQQITGWKAPDSKIMSPAEILLHQAQLLLTIEKEQELMRQQMSLEAQRVSELEKVVEQHDCELERIFKPDGEYYTVRGYASKIGFKNLTLAKAKAIGGEASKYCRANGIPTDKMADPRYGSVKCYPEKVLERFF